MNVIELTEIPDVVAALKTWKANEIDDSERYRSLHEKFGRDDTDLDVIIRDIVGLAMGMGKLEEQAQILKLSEPRFEVRWACWVYAIVCCAEAGREAGAGREVKVLHDYEAACRLIFTALADLQSISSKFFSELLGGPEVESCPSKALPRPMSAGQEICKESGHGDTAHTLTGGIPIEKKGKNRRRTRKQVAIAKGKKHMQALQSRLADLRERYPDTEDDEV